MSSSIDFKRFYNVFRSISTLVHASTNVDEVLELVVWKTADLTGAKGAVVRILDLKTPNMELFSAYGLGEDYLSKTPVSNIRT